MASGYGASPGAEGFLQVINSGILSAIVAQLWRNCRGMIARLMPDYSAIVVGFQREHNGILAQL